MGEVIAANAAVESVENDVRASLANAREAGGEVAEAAERRLADAVTSIDSSRAAFEATGEAEAATWRPVLAADGAADAAIGSVRDAMWNALGREKQRPEMDFVFPSGVRTYTAGDPREQPLLMDVLKSRIASVAAPASWPAERRQGWVAEVEAARVALANAVEAHRPADAALTVAEAGYRATVRAGHAQLAKLKRDLKNLGLSEAQIHAIIPDRGRRGSAASAKQKTEEPAASG